MPSCNTYRLTWVSLTYRFIRRLEGGRELVAAEVVAPDHDRMTGECPAGPGEVAGLLLLAREGRMSRNEELGAQQADALGAVGARRVDLLGEVHVAAQRHAHAVGRDGGETHAALE